MNYTYTRIYGCARVGVAHKEWEMDDGCNLDVVLMNDPLNTSVKPSVNLPSIRTNVSFGQTEIQKKRREQRRRVRRTHTQTE